MEIDKETGTDFWRKALQLEMSKIMPVVRILDSIEAKPIGYQQIPCYISFDVKMDFTSVGASPADANQEEKDLLDLGSANNMRVTCPSTAQSW